MLIAQRFLSWFGVAEATCPANTAEHSFVFSPSVSCMIVFVSQACCTLFSDERICVHMHTHRHTHTHLAEQQCRGHDWYILLRAHSDPWWEQVGLLLLDLLAPSGWSAGWPWVADWRLAWWRTGFVVDDHSADLLTTCMPAGRSSRQAGCLFCYFFPDWLEGWLISYWFVGSWLID